MIVDLDASALVKRDVAEARLWPDFLLGVTVTVKAENAAGLATELRQILQELGLADAVRVE